MVSKYEFAFVVDRDVIRVHTSDYPDVAAVLDLNGNILQNKIGDEIEAVLEVFLSNRDIAGAISYCYIYFTEGGFESHLMLDVMYTYGATAASILTDRNNLGDFTYQLYKMLPYGWAKALWRDLATELQEVVREEGIQNFRISEVREEHGRMYVRTSNDTKRIRDILRRYADLSSDICVYCGRETEMDDHIPICWLHRDDKDEIVS